MNLRQNAPELQLLMWRSEERALLARAEIRRQMGPDPLETVRLCTTMLRSGRAFLMRCVHWLTGHRDGALSLGITGQAGPTT